MGKTTQPTGFVSLAALRCSNGPPVVLSRIPSPDEYQVIASSVASGICYRHGWLYLEMKGRKDGGPNYYRWWAPQQEFEQMLAASSLGRYFSREFLGRYRSEKLIADEWKPNFDSSQSE